MARGVQRPQPPAGHLRPVAVGQEQVGLAGDHEAAQGHAGVAQLGQLGAGAPVWATQREVRSSRASTSR